jgi:hypothetical protein
METKPCRRALRPQAALFISPAPAASARPSGLKFTLAIALCNFLPQVAEPLSLFTADNLPRGLKCNRPAMGSIVPIFDSALPPVIPAPAAPQKAAIAISRAIPGASGGKFAPFCPVPSAAEAHQGGNAAPSCRLCLIACNSRKFTRKPIGPPIPTPEEVASSVG